MSGASEDANGKRPHSPRQLMLGLFILFQLGFLIVYNLLGFIKSVPADLNDEPKKLVNRVAPGFTEKRRHGWAWADEVETNGYRYEQLTGQGQDWKLFAPGVAKTTGFPAVVLLFDQPLDEGLNIPGAMFAFHETNGFNLCTDWRPPTAPEPTLILASGLGILAATNPFEAIALHAVNHERITTPRPRVEVMLSDNEPTDIHAYIRFGQCRLRRYESQFYINPKRRDGESTDDLARRLNEEIRDLIKDYHGPILAYLRWRRDAWMRDHPGEPTPKQVLLMHRLYRIHGPNEEHGWDGPFVLPMLRWQPNGVRGDSKLLEPFDFSDYRFAQ
jgi:hypothetical protein